MKYLKYILVLVAAYTLNPSLVAQNEIDVMRYSMLNRGGTARFMSLGGAMGALGGDFGAISTNPASLGTYRRGELQLSPSLGITRTNTLWSQETLSANNEDFHFNSIGAVFTSPGENMKKVSFAIGYNRLAEFDRDVQISAPNSSTSRLDQYVLQAEGVPADLLFQEQPFGAGLAYEAFAIDPIIGQNDQFVGAITGLTDKIISNNINQAGGMGEIVVAMGGNVNEIVHIGASVGFPNVNFSEISTYREEVTDPSVDLEYWERTQQIEADGSGANLKLGINFNLKNGLRIGGAYHTGTRINFTEQYSVSINSKFRSQALEDRADVLEGFEYSIRTPSRIILNAALIAGKAGFVSADYEYVDYRRANIANNTTNANPNAYDYAFENGVIENSFRGTHNVRVGGEWRATKQFKLRVGAGAQQNPFETALTTQPSLFYTLSGGLGYKNNGVFMDLAYVHTTNGMDYFMFNPAFVDAASIDTQRGQVVFTVGKRFEN